MGKQPAVVVIARHGARLDQADRYWQDTAAKPYDPPLTYGGWIQSQMLGVRIATELQSLDASATGKMEDRDDIARDAPPHKKRKVIIHSSPYLRCVQTSVAISAGLQHAQPVLRPAPRLQQRSSLSQAPLVQGDDQDPVTKTAANGEPAQEDIKTQADEAAARATAKLRMDPFLGEWLSPSYFEKSIPPPAASELMTAAKEGLRVPAEEIKGAEISDPFAQEFQSVDWEEKENGVLAIPINGKGALRAVTAAGHSTLPKRARNVSFGADIANGARSIKKGLRQGQMSGYSAPIPTYSIAPQDPIPIGFVAHARDACMNIDYLWDSMEEPLSWGDGGPFNEEWGSMHRRFRNGLQKMLSYYETLEDGIDDRHVNRPEIDGDEQLVLILVTHQAGCNALIRLLTGAPALHDVGLASLTMAVRKDGIHRTQSVISTSPTRRRGSLDLGIADDFDMKIIASTEHLRAGSNPLGLNSPRLGKSPAFASRRLVGADSPDGFSLGDPLSGRPSSSYGLDRTASQRSIHVPELTASVDSGLWRRGSRLSRDETMDSFKTPETATTTTTRSRPSLQSASLTTNSISEELFGSPTGSDSLSGTDDAGDKVQKGEISQLPVRSVSQRGLWAGESNINRARSPGKRRWTAVDKSLQLLLRCSKFLT